MPAIDALTALAESWAAYEPSLAAALTDDELLGSQRLLAEIRRLVDARSATIAAEIAHRSRRELGYDGLAQRLGARTPQLLVRQVTGATKREAQTLVRVGELMSEAADAAAPHSPARRTWLAPVTEAIVAGRLSIEAAEAIRVALGDAQSVSDLLEAAVATLLRESASLSVEQLAARARELRDELDERGVAEREQALRDRRYLSLIPQSDGMTRITGLLDPESAAEIGAAYDAATSPRRGGPRFVDTEAIEREQRLLRDERTTEQIALDALVELVRIGVAGDSQSVLGAHKPAVRVLVAERDLSRGAGPARLEGQTAAVSIATAERHACTVGIVPVLFDSGGQVVNVGRDQRLFTQRQRVGLAARDGGCRFPGCDRPPSWAEAHHIDQWHRDGGRTDLADGVLLCRHHHLLVHNNGWRVTRSSAENSAAEYFVVPPRSIDPAQRPIAAPAKSPCAERLTSRRAG